jgi:hypothetical protein
MGPWNPWLHDPGIGNAIRDFTPAMTANALLPDNVRQVAILVVGARFDAAYEIYRQIAVAEKEAMKAERLTTLVANLKPNDLSAEERVAFDFAYALADVCDMAAAQAFLPTFVARHNARFAVAPKCEEHAHKPWTKAPEALDAALATHEPRTLSKALTFSAGGAIHCIKATGAGIALRGAKVTVRCYLDGRMDVLFKDRILPYTTVRKLPRASQIEDDKTIDARLDEIITRTRRRHPSPGSVDGSGYGGPDPTTAPPSTPTSTKPSTLGGDIST